MWNHEYLVVRAKDEDSRELLDACVLQVCSVVWEGMYGQVICLADGPITKACSVYPKMTAATTVRGV